MDYTPNQGQKPPPKTGIKESDLNYPLKKNKDGKIGHALIIINKEFSDLNNREGADKDCENLLNMFGALDIEPVVHKDLEAPKIEIEIEKFVAEVSVNDSSVIFIAISSHGRGDNIMGVKHSVDPERNDCISVTRIQELLIKCAKLKDVPKVLILQACRGTEEQKINKTAVYKEEAEPTDFSIISDDTLIIYPTSIDYPAWRSATDGTWLIEQLCECVELYRNHLHLTEIMTMCTYTIIQNYKTKHGETQTCTFKSSLTKFLSFKKFE